MPQTPIVVPPARDGFAAAAARDPCAHGARRRIIPKVVGALATALTALGIFAGCAAGNSTAANTSGAAKCPTIAPAAVVGLVSGTKNIYGALSAPSELLACATATAVGLMSLAQLWGADRNKLTNPQDIASYDQLTAAYQEGLGVSVQNPDGSTGVRTIHPGETIQKALGGATIGGLGALPLEEVTLPNGKVQYICGVVANGVRKYYATPPDTASYTNFDMVDGDDVTWNMSAVSGTDWLPATWGTILKVIQPGTPVILTYLVYAGSNAPGNALQAAKLGLALLGYFSKPNGNPVPASVFDTLHQALSGGPNLSTANAPLPLTWSIAG